MLEVHQFQTQEQAAKITLTISIPSETDLPFSSGLIKIHIPTAERLMQGSIWG